MGANDAIEEGFWMEKQMIIDGKTSLGIEFGSTRIKAVLIGEAHQVLATGSHQWENRLEDGVWTYTLEDIWGGLQDCYRDLADQVRKTYGVTLRKIGALGISAMMHGYLAFDKDDRLLVPFRTWRNTITGEAAAKLTEAFAFNIPQRWSISHLYQAILNEEPHVSEVAFFTTLAGYVHWMLTGEKVLGVGDASGMFPIDSATGDYNARMVQTFDEMVADKAFGWKLRELLPKSISAGAPAGVLTAEGAKLLDVSGNLQAGVPMCPPEGDAGTGMTATNSVSLRTGNVSAGTSVFAMIVMDKEPEKVHEEIDMVTTPDGHPVAMVHCNNCTSDINAWAGLFGEFARCIGAEVDTNRLYTTLFEAALAGEADCGGLLSYNYFSGEPVTGFAEGRPLFAREVTANFTLGNFMRTHIYSALATLKVGLDILLKEESVPVDCMYGHGGLFKTKGVGQRMLAAAMNAPVSVMETAGEGGAWGIAVLAAYAAGGAQESLGDYLNNRVFCGETGEEVLPIPEDVAGFDAFMVRYKAGLAMERAAVENMK